MKNNYKTVIVGGGASGLACAIELLRGDDCLFPEEVLILEKNERVGKKLLATGNGQCNLSNRYLSINNYHGENREFIEKAIIGVQELNLCDYLSDLGIPLTVNKDGKIYPLSKQSTAVLDVFRGFLDYKKCRINTSEKAEKIVKKDTGFLIKTSLSEYTCNNLVLAFGGKSGKQFGTDGSSYSLATDLHHKITPLYPSLVQLKTQTDKIRGLKGLKEHAKVIARNGKKVLSSSVGDLLFTEFGVSGSAVFQVSGYLATVENPILDIEFLPEYSEKEIAEIIFLKQKTEYIAKEDVLTGLVNKRIGQVIYKNTADKSAFSLASALKSFCLNVTGTLGFDYSQVTKGGIKTDTVNALTFESKKQSGLYLIGEALDVDGDCGGYNLSFAFGSGIKAAKNIKSIINKVKR